MATAVIYKIKPYGETRYTTFDNLNVKVESATGLLSVPKRKTPVSVDWPELHGKIVDTAAPRYEEREIVLNCLITASNGANLYYLLSVFAAKFTAAGLHTLAVTIDSTTLTYDVYLEDIGSPVKTWGNGKVAGRFAVKLREPEPSILLPSTT